MEHELTFTRLADVPVLERSPDAQLVVYNGEVYQKEGHGGGIKEITYAKLKQLRDEAKLVPGAQYRIVDFVTTTNDDFQDADYAETYYRSAGHPFDLIVTADSANVLNENARAAVHEGDTYFQNARLEAWEIKYQIDNDRERYFWADDVSGKGVIWWMKDEHFNECWYDFKNIQFPRYKVLGIEAGSEFSADLVETIRDDFVGSWQAEWFDEVEAISDWEQGEEKWFYTFSVMTDAGDVLDSTIQKYPDDAGGSPTNGNVIRPIRYQQDRDFTGYQFCLNDIVFIAEEDDTDEMVVNGNVFELSCSSMTFGRRTVNNSFGNNCNTMVFGKDFNNNKFSELCHGNLFSRSCYENTFGNGCESNTFGNNCDSNTFGNNCYSNTFGNNCESNTFGNNCESNTFGNGCESNTFGNDCYSNTFGNNCYSNTFGNNCDSNTFGNDCYSNTFGNDCESNTFGNNCDSNTFGNNCYSNTFGYTSGSSKYPHSYYQYIILDNGVSYISLNSIASTSNQGNSSNYLKNIHIRLGVCGTSSTSRKNITISRNRSYLTEVKSSSSAIQYA